ncbi:hypothetical protein GCM10023209_37560 [Roseibacterium beibuensis]|uniref:Uncharacterized protein n=1 Tax=[Roseibacterium] beibuensis TaxID=1193142 RepID=A0ABP9LNQ9_9RHOB
MLAHRACPPPGAPTFSLDSGPSAEYVRIMFYFATKVMEMDVPDFLGGNRGKMLSNFTTVV